MNGPKSLAAQIDDTVEWDIDFWIEQKYWEPKQLTFEEDENG